jgi:hypothetical protein
MPTETGLKRITPMKNFELLPPPREGLPIFKRGDMVTYLNERVVSLASGCIEWLRGKDQDGYGIIVDPAWFQTW